MANIVERAGKAGADIVCLTETYYNCFIDLPLVEMCQQIPGEITGIISEKASLYGLYVIFSMYEKDGESIYNTAVLIGRKGELVGKYRKIHIPLYEGETGVTPGKEVGIFDTDFGRLGIMVCWDQVFPEVARKLSLMGAEIIFLPTLGDEPLQQRARAKDNGLHLVVAGMNGPEASRIITPKGEVAGTVKDGKEGVYITEIDLDQKYYTYWLSVGACNGEHKSLFKKERRISFLSEVNTL
jgi:predicted amidohydrolase